MIRFIYRIATSISARPGMIATAGFWLGFIIPPVNLAALGGVVPFHYFIVLALLTVNIDKVYKALFNKRLQDSNYKDSDSKRASHAASLLEAGLVFCKAMSYSSVGLALGGLLTYSFTYVRTIQ